ncbi:MAG TPA: formyltransferase family protein, partial [Synergistales bacterium]|nr:formyltransferase family protein [Synergistales bacterium]
MTSFCIVLSGRGSNMEALADAVRDGRLDARVEFVASDAPDAPGLEKAHRRGIDTVVLPYAS